MVPGLTLVLWRDGMQRAGHWRGGRRAYLLGRGRLHLFSLRAGLGRLSERETLLGISETHCKFTVRLLSHSLYVGMREGDCHEACSVILCITPNRYRHKTLASLLEVGILCKCCANCCINRSGRRRDSARNNSSQLTGWLEASGLCLM